MVKSAIGLLVSMIVGLSTGGHQNKAVPLGAGPYSYIPGIIRLVDQSDLILKGEVIGVDYIGTIQSTLESGENAQVKVMLAQVSVARVIKGPVPKDNQIDVMWYIPEFPAVWGNLEKGNYGLFFLANGAEGYTIADFTDPWLPVSAKPLQENLPFINPFIAIEAEFRNTLSDSDNKLACFAARALDAWAVSARKMDLQPVTKSALKNMAKEHPDPHCRAQAIECLLLAKDREVMPLASEILKGALSRTAAKSLDAASTPSSYRRFQTAGSAMTIRISLLIAMGAAIQKKEDLPYAIELLDFSEALAREEGLQGLRHIGSAAADQDTLSRVIARLRDSDREVQVQALCTLAELTDAKDPAWNPLTNEAFMSNPNKAPIEEYITRWEQSWQEHLKASEQAK